MEKLFNELIDLAKLQVDEIDRQQAEFLQKNIIGELFGHQIVMRKNFDPSPQEADAVRAEIVEAFALVGDLVSAEKFAKSINVGSYDEVMLAQESIIKGWARKDLQHALKLASASTKATDDDLDEEEQEEQRESAMFAILETIAETSEPDEVIKLANQVIRKPGYTYNKNNARIMCVRATAALGKLDKARKMAVMEEIPCNQVPEYLAVYEFSRAVEDIETARAIAEKYDYEPYEQWLKIAEATHEVRDIVRARAEIMAIPVKDTAKGWNADFNRNHKLLVLAKISQDQNDVTVAREALVKNSQTANSLFMELCRITRDPKDFALLLDRAKHDEDHYSALACIAGITREEVDFIAAFKAALSINNAPNGVSVEYLRGRSLAELAQVLSGKPLHR